MPISLAALRDDRATVVVHFGGQEGKVTYRPNAVTSEMIDQYNSDNEGAEEDAVLQLLVSLIESWEIEDVDGTMLPVTVPNAKKLPIRFATAINNAVIADIRVGEADGATLQRALLLQHEVMPEGCDWFFLIEAARYLKVPPWDLAERSIVWREWSLAAQKITTNLRNADHVG